MCFTRNRSGVLSAASSENLILPFFTESALDGLALKQLFKENDKEDLKQVLGGPMGIRYRFKALMEKLVGSTAEEKIATNSSGEVKDAKDEMGQHLRKTRLDFFLHFR